MPTSTKREADGGFALRPKFDLGLRHLATEWRALCSLKDARADLVAGLTVAAVAIPLSLAIAVASEVPPVAGLISAIVGAVVVAFTNGTALGVSGPAAAMAVLVGTLFEAHGMGGVLVAGLFAGALQLATGAFGLGRLARLVPSTVVHGFTAGIGAIILVQQFPRALGFPAPEESHVFDVFLNLGTYLSQAKPAAVGISALVIALAVLLPRLDRRIPALLISVILPTALVGVLGLEVLTIGEMPSSLPLPTLPSVDSRHLGPVLAAGAVIFLVASLETLLSSSAVDRMVGDARHDPDQELIGQGLGNIATALMGGIVVTGVIARSALNVQAGARTRRSAVVAGVGVLFAILFATQAMAQIPMAALAGVLLVVGARMIHPGSFLAVWRFSRAEALVMLVTFFTIVVVDLLAGIQAGVGAAIILAAIRLGRSRSSLETSPSGPAVLSLRGPQTFLAGMHTEEVRNQLDEAELERGLVVDLRDVHEIDSSGVGTMAAIVGCGLAAGGGVALLGARGKVLDSLMSSSEASLFAPILAASATDADAIVTGTLRGRQQLVHGVTRFRQEDRARLAGIFEQIAQTQRPHTLFVTCGDSRIAPSMLTGTDPGEIFVLRNIGGLMPVAGCAHMENERTGLRYAVDVLGVSDIVICSHSNCGAVGLLRTPVGAELDPFAGFREVAATATGDVTAAPTTDEAARRVAVRQVQNLLTHDFIRARVQEGALQLHAWFYDVGTPELYEWDPETDRFEPVG